ncbi:MAG: acetate uptake transporter [Candidatus Korobacteraceae bacterium]
MADEEITALYKDMLALKSAGMHKEWWANPAVVGLMGFGLTTMATGLHNVGYWSAGITLALAITFGGTAQFIAGVVDLRKGSIFGGSAFMCYGAFWWSIFVLLYVQPKTGIPAGPHEELGFFLLWTLFTLGFCIAVQGIGKFLAALFWLLLLAFILLDGVVLGIVSPKLAGWEIFIVGLLAWYIATATLANTVYGRKVLPLS